MTDKLSDDVKHDLDLLLNDNTIAFFAIHLEFRSITDDLTEFYPTIIEYVDKLDRQERLHIARELVYLGKKIRDAALRG